MLTILTFMLLGIAAGYLMRRRTMGWLDSVTRIFVWLLLFLLGVEAGGDPRIVGSLGSLGSDALALSLAGVVGSALSALFLWRYVIKERTGEG